MYDFNVIVGFWRNGRGGGYKDIQLWCNTYACLYIIFFLVDKINNKLKTINFKITSYKIAKFNSFFLQNNLTL